VSLLLHEQNEQ